MRFSIIVSLDNNYELTTNFIETLILNTDFSDGELVIITDGCKYIDTLNYLNGIKVNYNFVKLLTLEIKKGYSIANNEAVKNSKGEILIFLNSDVFPCIKSVNILVDYILNCNSVGAAQGRLVYPQNNRIQTTGHLFIENNNFHLYKGKPYNHPLVMQQGERQALTTAFCAIRRDIFFENGCFNEKYYNAYEGMELTLRIGKTGMNCMYLPEAIAYHITGGTRNRISFDDELAGRQFWTIWHKIIKTDVKKYLLPQITTQIQEQIYFVINCNSLIQWNKILEEIRIETNGEIIVSDRFEKSINLYNNLPFKSLHYAGPYLFLCNNFSSLIGNHNWFVNRNNPLDLVIDCHANVEMVSNFINSSE